MRGFGAFLVIYGTSISSRTGVEQQKASFLFCPFPSRPEGQELMWVPVWIARVQTHHVGLGMRWERLSKRPLSPCVGVTWRGAEVTSLKHLLKLPWFKSRAEEPDSGVALGWARGMLGYLG